QHRAAGRDLAYERQHVRLGRRPRGTAPLTPDQLECARLRRVTPQQPGTLEVGEMRVDGRRRGETHGFADLPNRRRVAVLIAVVDEEIPDLPLSRCEHPAPFRTCVRSG